MKAQDIKHLSTSQYASPDKLHARWDLYEYSVPLINIHEEGIKRLHLNGSENVLEVGCGDGSVLLNLKQNGHAGKLSGLEINSIMFAESAEAQKELVEQPIEFIVGSADSLPFPDKSFDVIVAFFMLYHMPDIQKTLVEWSRVLKDNGKILIATGSSSNKPKHSSFKKLAEKITGKKGSAPFSSSFNMENGEKQLSKVFKITDTFIYKGQLKLTDPQPYMDSFNSLKDMYEPMPTESEWENVGALVRAEVQKEIDQTGFYVDTVKRGFFICGKIV